MTQTILLDFDSELFGFKAAKIVPERMTASELEHALADLREKGVRLVYWASDSSDAISQQAAHAHNGFLADHKVTYLQTPINVTANNTTGVVSYAEADPTQELITLALESGLYSRFKVDPTMLPENFVKLYQTWTTNSTRRQIAKEVLVIYQQQKIVAMATLGEKQGRGDIGLIAVAEHSRGQGLGQKLVEAAKQWFYEHDYRECQVVTQQANQQACKFYERCGFHVEKVENFYHFWL